MAEPEGRALPDAWELGFLLAAELAGDRGAWLARPALAEGRVGRVASLAGELESLPREARAETWREAAASLRRVPVAGASRLPARARALLASEVPRAVGARWLREAPPPRRGFVAEEGLRAVVRSAARRADGEVDAALVARARGSGRRLLAAALRGPSAEAARDFVAQLEADEAGAVLALAQIPVATDLPDAFAFDVEPSCAASLLVVAAGSAPRPERVVALGVMAEALTRPAQDGDGRVRAWRRLALEIASIGAAQTPGAPGRTQPGTGA